MFSFFNNLKISHKLSLFTSTILLIIMVFGIISFITVNNTKVNGDIYQDIILGKDLIADILPPPEYVIEAYLVCNQLYFESDQSKINNLTLNIGKLKKDFLDRHSYWEKNLEMGNIKNTLLMDSYKPAMEFFDIIENQYIPAISSNNIDLSKEILTNKIRAKYEIHREAIDKVVTLANERNTIKENNAKEIIAHSIMLMTIIGICSILLSIIFSYITIRAIVIPIKQATQMALQMAKGDFKSSSKQLTTKTS